MKFDILSEDEIVSKICELNPNFKKKTTILSTNNENDSNHRAEPNDIKKEPTKQPHQNEPNGNGGYFKTDTDLDLKDKIEQLKRVKQEQERQFRTQQAQMQAEHRHQQQEHEKQLKLKLQSNSNAIQLQLNLNHKQQQKQQQIQHQQNARFQQQQHQQKLKTEMIEAKRIEKCLQRERKTREKWFEYIMSREQQSAAQSAQILPADSESHTHPFEPIDDMQEKHLKPMPELKQLHISDEQTVSLPLPANIDLTSIALDWVGDSLQVIEFLSTFGEKLKESIEGESSESATNSSAQGQSEEVAIFQFSSMISNIDSFRCGLENKSEKLRKETTYLIQFLLKAAINNTNSSSAELDNSSSSTSTDAGSSDLGNYI